MTVDVERGLVFLPLGSATYDYYGGDRKGANLFGSTLVALDAPTGKRRWHFQTTHHDIWDYDLESPPALIDVTRNGQRDSGGGADDQAGPAVHPRPPHRRADSRRRRAADAAGTALLPASTPGRRSRSRSSRRRSRATASARRDLANITPAHRQSVRACCRRTAACAPAGRICRSAPSQTLLFPGTLGGGNWHGTSFNPQLGYLFVNTQNVGEVYQIVNTPGTDRWRSAGSSGTPTSTGPASSRRGAS